MSHKSYKQSHKKQYNHPVFLIDDQSQSNSQAHCSTCTQYEQDINILQQKLMQTHNKLIEQIDICREQELKIMKLSTSSNGQFGKDIQNNTNLLNTQAQQRSQQSGKIIKKGDEQYLYSIQPLIQAKTQLLRNDLQAMRAKVLSQILKSNKLKQEIRDIDIKHQKQIQEFREKMKRMEINKNKLVDENQKLTEYIQSIKKLNMQNKNNPKCVCGYEQKYYQLDKAFMNQRVITNKLIEENNVLQNKIHDLHENQIKNGYQQQLKNHRDYKAQEIRTQPKKRKAENRQKFKEEFQATKNLIKKLQQAQLQIRNKQYDRI